MIKGTAKAFRTMRNRRRMYAAVCMASSAGILWGLVRMAMASPNDALVVALGGMMIALARCDYTLWHGRRER